METVTGLQLSADGVLSRQTVEMPPPAVDEVVVDVSAVVLCDDVASRSRAGTPGRHFVGTVSERGAATQWQVGDRVVSAPPGSCGRCRQCVRGSDAYCSTFSDSYAERVPGVTIDGGLAERVRVPAQLLVPVGDIDPTAAVLASSLGCLAMNAIKETAHAITIGDPAVIIGSNALASYTAAAVDAASAATVVHIADPENPADEASAKLDRTHGIPVVLVMERTQPGCDLAARLATAGGEIVVANTGSGAEIGRAHV